MSCLDPAVPVIEEIVLGYDKSIRVKIDGVDLRVATEIRAVFLKNDNLTEIIKTLTGAGIVLVDGEKEQFDIKLVPADTINLALSPTDGLSDYYIDYTIAGVKTPVIFSGALRIIQKPF